MARFMIKASEYKNVCKAVNDRKLAELKKEIIEILKKQDEKEVKKAIDYFNSQELHYTHLEKSFTGKWVEKAGYGIGTVRIWKGKKYKKIAPGKWARVFEKEGRGTNIAIGKLIAKVQKIDNVEDLMAFVMANKQRFVDENGVDLPVLDKLRAAVDARNGSVGSKTSGLKLSDKELERLKERNMTVENLRHKGYTDEEIKEFAKPKASKEEIRYQVVSGYENKSQNEIDKDLAYLKKQAKSDDSMTVSLVGSEKMPIKDAIEILKDIKKNNNTKAALKEVEDAIDNAGDYDDIEELEKERKQLLKKLGKKPAEKTDEKYDRELVDSWKDDYKDFSTDVLKEKIEEYTKVLERAKNDNPSPDQRVAVKQNEHRLKALNELLEEKEETEKYNDSKAYEGKLATQKQVDEATAISNKYEVSRNEMLKKPITTIQKYANSTVEDFEGGIDKFIEYMAEGRSDGVSMDEVGKEFAKLINHNVARKIWDDYESGALEVNDDGIFEPKKETKEKPAAEKNNLSDKDKKMMKDYDLSESDYLYLKDKVFNELNPDKDGIQTGVSIQGLSGELYEKDNKFKKLVDKIEAQRPGSSRFYGDFMYQLKKNEDVTEPKEESETYWIQDSRGNRLTNEDAKKRLMADIENLKEYKNEYLLDRLNPEDRKEIESEFEKTKNRSDAMKGNQNARKYGLTDEQIEYYDIQKVVEEINGYPIVENSKGKYSFVAEGRVKDRPEDFETNIDKVKERINDHYETEKNIKAAKNYDFKNAKLGSDVQYTKKNNGNHLYFKKSPNGSKAISVTVEVSDMREPLNMVYEVSDTKTGESWQYETAYGNKEGLEWAVEKPEQMEKELKKFFKRDPNKEWNKQNGDYKPQDDVYAPSESTDMETKKAIAENKNIGENEVQMPYSKELAAEMEGLKNCTSKDPTREFMTKVYYKDGNLIATDARRLKTVKVGKLDGIEDGTYVDIDVSRNGINIKKNEFNGNFPNYSRVIPDNLSQKVTLDNDVLKQKLKDMRKDGAIDKKGLNGIQFEFKDGKVYLDGTEVGKADNVNLTVNTGSWTQPNDEETNYIAFNADYLENALNGKNSVMMLSDNADKAVGISTDSTVNVLMPLQHQNQKMDYSESRKKKADEQAKKADNLQKNRRYNEELIKDFLSGEKFDKLQDKVYSTIDDKIKEFSDDELKRNYDIMNLNMDKIMDRNVRMLSDKVDKKTGASFQIAYAYSKLKETHPDVMDKFREEFKNRGIEIKKSLFDDFITDVFEDDEDEEIEDAIKADETEYNDYSAEQPELFNSTELMVREAFNRCRVL